MTKNNLEDYINCINSSKDAQDGFKVFTSIMQDFGFDKVAYSLVTDHPSLGLKRVHGIVNSFPQEWMDYYMEQGFFDVDPVPEQIVKSAVPFFWSSLVQPEKLSKKSLSVMTECEDAGLNDGAIVPLYSTGGEVASVSLARQDKSGNNSYEDLAAIQFITTYFHENYKNYLRKIEPVELTLKETELLVWASEGKTDPEISEILNISLPTVRYRWNNIFQKLDAYGRVYAVTKAIRMQLIKPYSIKNYQKR